LSPNLGINGFLFIFIFAENKTVKIEIEEIIKKYAEVEAEEVLRIFNEYKGKSK